MERHPFGIQPNAPRPNQRGFTLLEVALTIVIIAVVLSVTLPSISRGTDIFRLRATGRDLVNTMRYAREKAVTEQQETRVVVDREGHKVMLTDELGDGSRTLEVPKEIRVTRVVLAVEEIREGTLVIRFLPNGSADNAEIQIASARGSQLRVVTDSLTGGARVMPVEEGGAQ